MEPSFKNGDTELVSPVVQPRRALTLAALGQPTWDFGGISTERASHLPENQVDSGERQVLPISTLNGANDNSDFSKLDQRSERNGCSNLPSQNSFARLDHRLNAYSRYEIPQSQSTHYRSQSEQPRTQHDLSIQRLEQHFDYRDAALTSRYDIPQNSSSARCGNLPDSYKNKDSSARSCKSGREPEPRVYGRAELLITNTSKGRRKLLNTSHLNTVDKTGRFHRASTAEPSSLNKNLHTLAWLAGLQQIDNPREVPFEDSPLREPPSCDVFCPRPEITAERSKIQSIQSSSLVDSRSEWMSAHVAQICGNNNVLQQTIPSKRNSSNDRSLSDQLKKRKTVGKRESDSRTFFRNSDNRPTAFRKPNFMVSDLQRHRESTPLDWSAPSLVGTKSYLENGKLQQEVPDIISLISSDDSIIDGSPTKRSERMEDRILPVKKVSAWKKPVPLRPPGVSESTAPKRKCSTEFEEEQRQKRAAAVILAKEDNCRAKEIFGEESLDEEAKSNDRKRQHIASQFAKRAKEIRDEEQREAKLRAEILKNREAEEKAELLRLINEQEEAKKKAVRDAKRLEDAAAHEKDLDDKRRAAAERIEAQRLMHQENQSRRPIDEGFRPKQAEGDALQTRKLNQEIAKKQAASLRGVKIADAEDLPIRDDQESLFLTKDVTKNKVGIGKFLLNEVKSKGPRNAAEVFAQSRIGGGISGYRAHREAIEKRLADKNLSDSQTQSKIRRNARSNSRADKSTARPKRPVSPQASKFSTTNGSRMNCKSLKISGFIIDDFEDDSDAIKTSEPLKIGSKSMLATNANTESLAIPRIAEPASNMPQPRPEVNQPTSSYNIANSTSNYIQSRLPTLVSRTSAPSVKLLSEVQRAEIEKSLATTRKAKRERRTEQQKLARKKNDDEKAKQKKRLELIEAANQAGAEISETMLDIQVEAYMTKRENGIQRRKEMRERKQANDKTEPDAIAAAAFRKEASIAPRLPAPEVETDNEDHENDSPEIRQLKAERRARKQSEADMVEALQAYRKERGGAFSNAANKTHVADLDSESEMSEEDPDESVADRNRDSLLPISLETQHNVDQQNDTGASSDHEQHDNVFTDPGKSSSSANTSFGSPLTFKSKFGLVSKDQVFLYTVVQQQTIDGQDQESEVVGSFFALEEANTCAQNLTEAVRQRYRNSFPSVNNTFEDRMYTSQIWYDETGENGLFVRVARQRQAMKDLSKFGPVNVPERLPEKSWLIKQSTTRVDEATEGQPAKEIREMIIVPGLQYSNLIDANYAACKAAIDFLRPKTAKMDHVEQYNNDLCKQLRETRDQEIEKNQTFRAEIEIDDDSLSWMKPLRNIIFEAEEFVMMGPTN